MAAWKKTLQVRMQATEKKDTNAAVSRINQLIAEENGKIEKYYEKIGEKYAQLHPADYEESFSELMQSLADSQRKLADYSMQMQFVTGVIICTNPGCGHKAPKGSVFCNMCGTKLPEFNFDNYEVCDSCGSLVEKGENSCPICHHTVKAQKDGFVQCVKCREFVGKENRFCPACGEPLVSFDPPEVPAGKICPKCNSAMSADKFFCTECGSKLN